MSPENRRTIQEAVAKAGDLLKGKLQPSEEHPERNSYAHVWRAIKDRMGKSYKDCDDGQLDEILSVIEEVELNAMASLDATYGGT